MHRVGPHAVCDHVAGGHRIPCRRHGVAGVDMVGGYRQPWIDSGLPFSLFRQSGQAPWVTVISTVGRWGSWMHHLQWSSGILGTWTHHRHSLIFLHQAHCQTDTHTLALPAASIPLSPAASPTGSRIAHVTLRR